MDFSIQGSLIKISRVEQIGVFLHASSSTDSPRRLGALTSSTRDYLILSTIACHERVPRPLAK